MLPGVILKSGGIHNFMLDFAQSSEWKDVNKITGIIFLLEGTIIYLDLEEVLLGIYILFSVDIFSRFWKFYLFVFAITNTENPHLTPPPTHT